MFCKNCGKELNDHAIFCPGCGVSIKPKISEPKNVAVATVYNVYAIIGFICSFLIPIVGLVFGCMGYDFAKKNNSNGKKMSIASIILSSISIFITVVTPIVMISIFA